MSRDLIWTFVLEDVNCHDSQHKFMLISLMVSVNIIIVQYYYYQDLLLTGLKYVLQRTIQISAEMMTGLTLYPKSRGPSQQRWLVDCASHGPRVLGHLNDHLLLHKIRPTAPTIYISCSRTSDYKCCIYFREFYRPQPLIVLYFPYILSDFHMFIYGTLLYLFVD